MEKVVAELREKLERRRSGAATFDGPEARLRRACSRGSGHVVITGSDRAEIHAVLARVLDTVEPLRAVRTLAIDSDPYATVDRVISALDADIEADTYLDRDEAMLALLARAEEIDKSIFVIVDDADAASIEQLEQLRSSLAAVPEAFERLRLVLVGNESLVRKLEEPAAEALGAEITTRVSVDARPVAETSHPADDTLASVRNRALPLAVAVAVTLCATAYSLYATGLTLGGAAKAPAPAPAPATPHASHVSTWAIRGDEPFLYSALRIAAASSALPTKTVIAPKPTPTPKPASPAPVTSAQSPSSPGGNALPARAAHAAPKPPRPVRAEGTIPSPGSSIDSFMKRFPTTR
jgi:hypothetical protein